MSHDILKLSFAEYKAECDDEESEFLDKDLLKLKKHCKNAGRALLLDQLLVAESIPGILTVFLEIENECSGGVWMIVGDIPTAIFERENGSRTADALKFYVTEMQNWIDSILLNRKPSTSIPVAAPSTKRNAYLLQSRLEFIESRIIPEIEIGWE